MVLPGILRNRPQKPSEQMADLQARVLALSAEVSRLSRELSALKAQGATVAVQRSGCALIADRLGINERTVRGVLVSHARFAPVRAKLAAEGTVITRSKPFLAWLADNLETWPS